MMTLPLLLMLAAAPVAEKVVLKVGEQRLSPAAHAIRCNCEDKKVVAGILVDGRIELKGLEPGTTKCSLLEKGKAALVVEVTVAK